MLLKSKTRNKREKVIINPYKLFKKATDNLNKSNLEKYEIAPETVEEKAIESKEFNDFYDFHRFKI